MRFLKLNKDQFPSLVVRCNCSARNAIDDAIDFVIENELKGADLIYDDYTMGIYRDDFEGRREAFAHDMENEFLNWKKNYQP